MRRLNQKPEPVLDGNGNVIGHVPVRKSKNPIVGIVRCQCGLPKTLHNPKGKRAGYWYSMCDSCGTDQQSGDFVQQKYRAEKVDVIENLPDFAPTDLVSETEPSPKIDFEAGANTEKEAEKQIKDTGLKPSNTRLKPESDDLPETVQSKAETEAEPDGDETDIDTETKKLNKPLCIGLGAVLGAIMGAIAA